MRTNLRLWALGALLVMSGLALAACGGAPERTGQQPTVQVQIPESVSSRVNTPLTVRASASDVDGPGIVRVEMQVDNTLVDTVEAAEPTPTLSANLSFTPTAEGTISVMVVAIAADGVSSAPVTFVLTVVGEEAIIEEESTEDVASSVTVEAQANVEVNVYASPGIGCEVLGVWTAGDFGTLLEMTDNPDPETVWYKTNYLSEDQPGWVFYEDLTLSGDDSVLMKVSETGCPFCGDGRLNQDSEVCDIIGCEDGLVCNTACQCVVPAPAAPAESEATCGNGIVESGEACESNPDCGSGFVCDACLCFEIVIN